MVNGKVYVGQTINSLADRWSKHKYTPGCKYLKNAIKKYGSDKFTIKLITITNTQECADHWERHFIKHYRSTNRKKGYNIRSGGHAGSAISDQTKILISKKNRGEGNGQTKLSEADVIAIRQDPRAQHKIAKDYGVGRGTIEDIKHNRTWSYLTTPLVKINHQHEGKLTDEQRLAIAMDTRFAEDIAKDYNITRPTVSRIKKSTPGAHIHKKGYHR